MIQRIWTKTLKLPLHLSSQHTQKKKKKKGRRKKKILHKLGYSMSKVSMVAINIPPFLMLLYKDIYYFHMVNVCRPSMDETMDETWWQTQPWPLILRGRVESCPMKFVNCIQRFMVMDLNEWKMYWCTLDVVQYFWITRLLFPFHFSWSSSCMEKELFKWIFSFA